jgi:hypothetical protein
MKPKKSPQCLAGRLKGYKSGYRTIANPNIKNNTPDRLIKGKVITPRRMAGHISIAEQAMKKETAEEREDRLYFSKVFDLQEWGNRRSLYLFAYSISYKEDGREEATGYFFTDEEKIQTNTGCDLFIIIFDTNNEGDGEGFIAPRKNEAFKTSLDFAKTEYFIKSIFLLPVNPAYSYLLSNDMILPLEHHQPKIKRKTGICGYIFDPSQMKRLDIDGEL